jgi:hypothetical protein
MDAAKTVPKAFVRLLAELKRTRCRQDAAIIDQITAEAEAARVLNAQVRRLMNDWAEALEKEK